MASQDKTLKLLESWRKSPLKFVRECLGVSPTRQQEEGLVVIGKLVQAKVGAFKKEELKGEDLALSKKMGISIMSGQGTGKDAFAAWCIIWFLCCFSRPKIPCTAPTSDQLQKVLWAEIYKWLNKRNDKGEYVCAAREWLTVQNDKVFLKEREGKDWFAIARTSSTNSSPDEQAETLAGFHEDYMMIVADEASGIPDGVFKPLEGTLTGKCNFIMMIFNPTRRTGFAINSHFQDRENWVCLHWDSEQSEIVTPEQIERMEKKYGRDSNAFRVRVNGLPPSSESDTLIPWDWVMDAVDRDVVALEDDPVVLGVDVARQGDDKSVIMPRQGNKVHPIKVFSKIDTMELSGWVGAEMAEWEARATFIDVIGVGAGVYDRLRELGRQVYGVNVAESAAHSEKFERLRDELWWRVRERFEKRLVSIPNDDELIGELSSIKFKYTSKGKIKIESKADMKKRGLKSPNKADALCLTYYWTDAVLRPEKEEKYKGRVSHGTEIGMTDRWMSA